MIFDGTERAKALTELLRVRRDGRTVTLALIASAPNFATTKYLAIKERVAADIGVTILRVELPGSATTDEVLSAMEDVSARADGMVLQLPFPPTIDLARLLEALPREKDVDVLGSAAQDAFRDGVGLLPPVVGAIDDIAETAGIAFAGKRVVVVGNGRLVGAPAALYARRAGADVVVLTKRDTDISHIVRGADILILGAGVPGLITPSMCKEGVVIFDAGTSEDAGKLVGDADPACAVHATLMTPVPGGIGPVAVVKLFENLLTHALPS